MNNGEAVKKNFALVRQMINGATRNPSPTQQFEKSVDSSPKASPCLLSLILSLTQASLLY